MATCESGAWKTADGRVVLIGEMSDSHLEAAISQIERAALREYHQGIDKLTDGIRVEQPEYARELLIKTLDQARREGPRPDRQHPLYRALIAERGRRMPLEPQREIRRWWDDAD